MSEASQLLEGDYSVVFAFRMPLRDYRDWDPGEEFVREFTGKVVFTPGTDGATHDELGVGTLTGYVIHADRAADAGEDLFGACDSHSRGVRDYFDIFYDMDTGQFKDEVAERFDYHLGSQNLLAIDIVELDPMHRGRGVGLAAVVRTIDLLGAGCGLVALQPFPLQFGGRSNDEAWKQRMVTDRFGVKKSDGLQKLRQYWKRLGFRRIGKTEYYALSPSLRQPTLRMVCPQLHKD